MTWRNVLVDRKLAPPQAQQHTPKDSELTEVRLPCRVGMLVHGYYPGDVRVRRTAEALAAAGLDVHVICLREPAGIDGVRPRKQEQIRGVNIHRVGLSKQRGGTLRYLFEYTAITAIGMVKLIQLHLTDRFDVVHVHNMPDMLVFAGLIPKWTGAKLVLDIHDPMSELFQTNHEITASHLVVRAIRFQEWASYKCAHHLVTVSQPMAENIAKKIHRDSSGITVIQNCPDHTKFPIPDGMIRWPRHKDTFIVLYAGTITECYRLDIAVRAIAIASKEIPLIRFHILAEDNRLLRQIFSLAKELGISEHVEHLGFVKHEAVKDVIARADVGISTHQGGPFGDLYFSNKIVEFLTQDLPVVVSKTKTVATYLPEDSVFFFQPGDSDHCARQLVKVWNEPGLVVQKLKKARQVALRLNWDSERENLIKFYKKLLDGAAAGS